MVKSGLEPLQRYLIPANLPAVDGCSNPGSGVLIVIDYLSHFLSSFLDPRYLQRWPAQCLGRFFAMVISNSELKGIFKFHF